MGLFKKEVKEENLASIYSIAIPKKITVEKLKGLEEIQKKISKSLIEKLGKEHPFDYEELEKLYVKFGLITAVVDKYIDYIVSGGFYVKAPEDENGEKAKEIIDTWLQEVNFDTHLRAWLKEALLKGPGYMELSGKKEETPDMVKVLNSNNMYVKKDDTGEIEQFNQYTGSLARIDESKLVPFAPWEIADLNLNRIAGHAYGLGVIYPALVIIDKLLAREKDMDTLMTRKANSPMHIKVGSLNKETRFIPKQQDLDSYAASASDLRNNQEWVTGPETEIKVIDFGNIGEKFSFVLEHYMDILVRALQVPEVLMGKGNIPEGLAKEQSIAFERRIQSFQAEVEKVVEEKIFKRILTANGLDVHIEFEWGEPSQDEKNTRIQQLTTLLGNMQLNPSIRGMLEEEIVRTLGLDVSKIEDITAQRQKELTQSQPIVPGQNQKSKESAEEDIKISEWLGFNYLDYLGSILSIISQDEFAKLKANNAKELIAGYLNGNQISKLKEVFKDNFVNGGSIKSIERAIIHSVRPGDLFELGSDGQLAFDKEGKPIVILSQKARAAMIARTETTRLASNGALNYYQDAQLEKVSFIAAIGQRTCSECESYNGKIFNINEAYGLIPVHANCRCTWRAVV